MFTSVPDNTENFSTLFADFDTHGIELWLKISCETV